MCFYPIATFFGNWLPALRRVEDVHHDVDELQLLRSELAQAQKLHEEPKNLFIWGAWKEDWKSFFIQMLVNSQQNQNLERWIWGNWES